MKVNGEHFRTVWIEDSVIRMIDQTVLPHSFEIKDIRNIDELCDSINNMTVRGAGAIGAAGGYGIVQAAMQADHDNFIKSIENAAGKLKNTRPTAQNLFAVIDRLLSIIRTEDNRDRALARIIEEGHRLADQDAEACMHIGKHGASLIKDGDCISTHCNAGWLAFVDWGSALSPVYYAVREQNKNVFVYVDETRPRCQGASLTAWELLQEKISHAIIADNAAGALMSRGKIDIVITGADRIALNGDVANKIGTYSSAVCARENGIPFYVAAPSLTIDPECASGERIPIEERDEEEIHYACGIDDNGGLSRVRISPYGCRAINIAFDVTPARYISGIITEFGIFEAGNKGIEKILKERQ